MTRTIAQATGTRAIDAQLAATHALIVKWRICKGLGLEKEANPILCWEVIDQLLDRRIALMKETAP